MSTPATETTPGRPAGETRPQAQGKGLQKKYGPLPAWAWVTVAAAGAVVVWLWLRNRNASSATSTAGQCYDSNGNIVPCPSGGDTGALTETEYQSLLAAIQALQGTPSTTPTGNRYTAITTKETLLNLAREYGLTEGQLVALNPQLVQFDKPKTDVPAGLQIVIGPPPPFPAALNSPGTGTFGPGGESNGITLTGASTTSSGSTASTASDASTVVPTTSTTSAAPAANQGSKPRPPLHVPKVKAGKK